MYNVESAKCRIWESESPFLFFEEASLENFSFLIVCASSLSHSRSNTRNDVERCVENIKWKIIACGKKGRYAMCSYCELKSKNENNSYAKMVSCLLNIEWMWQENINERPMEMETKTKEEKWRESKSEKGRAEKKLKLNESEFGQSETFLYDYISVLLLLRPKQLKWSFFTFLLCSFFL